MVQFGVKAAWGVRFQATQQRIISVSTYENRSAEFPMNHHG